MRFPFISREHHEAVSQEKDRLIVALKAQIARLEFALDRPRDPLRVTVKLPDDFAVVSPAVVATRRRKPDAPPARETDWANLDPNNLAQIAEVAARELGPGRHNVVTVEAKINAIKNHIVMARQQRARNSAQMGSVGTIVSPTAETVAAEIAELEESRTDVPAHIQELITKAAKGTSS